MAGDAKEAGDECVVGSAGVASLGVTSSIGLLGAGGGSPATGLRRFSSAGGADGFDGSGLTVRRCEAGRYRSPDGAVGVRVEASMLVAPIGMVRHALVASC